MSRTPSRPVSGLSQRSASTSSALLDKSPSLARAVAAAGPNYADQLALLKERYAQLEAEVKSSQESVQYTIKQNRQTWMVLKQENKELKQELTRRGGPTGKDASKSQVEKMIEKLEKEVHDLRRQYDKTMQEKKTAVSRLENLQDSMRELNKAAAAGGAATAPTASRPSSSAPSARALRQLENRLDKASVKCNEAQSIRRTYEQVLDKMKAEAVQFEPQLRTLEETIRAKGAEHDAAIIAHSKAQHAKEAAKQELVAMEEKLARERARRDKALTEQRAQAQILQGANQALLEHQFGAAPPGAAGAGADGGSQGSSAAEADPADDGPTSLEDAVQRLCAATATSSIAAMLEKVAGQQETLEKLTAMRATAASRLAEATQDVEGARRHLEELRSGGKLTTQSQLDAAQAEAHEAVQRADAVKATHDQIMRVYVDVRAGLDHLSHMCSPLPLPPGQLPVPMSDDTLGDVLAQCQSRLTAAHKFIHTLPKAAQLLTDLNTNPDFAFA